jgi:hypothetical protein
LFVETDSSSGQPAEGNDCQPIKGYWKGSKYQFHKKRGCAVRLKAENLNLRAMGLLIQET